MLYSRQQNTECEICMHTFWYVHTLARLLRKYDCSSSSMINWILYSRRFICPFFRDQIFTPPYTGKFIRITSEIFISINQMWRRLQTEPTGSKSLKETHCCFHYNLTGLYLQAENMVNFTLCKYLWIIKSAVCVDSFWMFRKVRTCTWLPCQYVLISSSLKGPCYKLPFIGNTFFSDFSSAKPRTKKKDLLWLLNHFKNWI